MQPTPPFQNQHPPNPFLPIPPPLHLLPTFNDPLKTILDENQVLSQKLTDPMITQLSNALQIDDDHSTDRNLRLKKIKGKMINIFLNEKDKWEQYLTLPKFQELSTSLKDIFNAVMNQVWNKYKNEGKEKSFYSRYTKYTCNSEIPKEIEGFHCSMFNFIICGFFGEGFQNSDMLRPVPLPRNHFPFPPPRVIQPGFPYQGDPHNLFPSKVKLEEGIFQNQPRCQPVKPKEIQKTKPISAKNQSKAHQSTRKKGSKKAQQSDSKNTVPFSIIHEKFIRCVCEGTKGPDFNSFKCKVCSSRIHLQCLGIPEMKLNCQPFCPHCLIKWSNVLYAPASDPIDIFWSDSCSLYMQSVTIKGKQCQQVMQNKHRVQIRFLKINGEKYLDWNDSNQKVSKKSKNQFFDVFIENSILLSYYNQELKISLDCMKYKENEKKPFLVLVAAYAVKKRPQSDIKLSIFQNQEPDYLDKLLKDDEEISIGILTKNQRLMNTPVRGVDCKHGQVFDLDEFVEEFTQTSEQRCNICGKMCRDFRLDGKVGKQIDNILSNCSDMGQPPKRIYYSKKGFRWSSNNSDPQPQIDEPINEGMELIQKKEEEEEYSYQQ